MDGLGVFHKTHGWELSEAGQEGAGGGIAGGLEDRLYRLEMDWRVPGAVDEKDGWLCGCHRDERATRIENENEEGTLVQKSVLAGRGQDKLRTYTSAPAVCLAR